MLLLRANANKKEEEEVDGSRQAGRQAARRHTLLNLTLVMRPDTMHRQNADGKKNVTTLPAAKQANLFKRKYANGRPRCSNQCMP